MNYGQMCAKKIIRIAPDGCSKDFSRRELSLYLKIDKERIAKCDDFFLF
ncbi:MAG: hypothetical protein ACTSUX_01465 [Promethearchaeota archaeon]